MNRLLAVLLLLAMQDKPKHPWLGHKEGSWLKTRETTTVGNGKPKIVERKTAIVKVDGKNVTVAEESTIEGEKGPAMERTIVAEEEKLPQGEKEDLGKEKVKVGTKTYDCALVEYVAEQGTSKVITRLWTAREAPGKGLVKKLLRIVDTAAGVSTTTTTLSKVDETIKAGSKSVRGWIFETAEETRTQKSTTKSWYSEQIPGWLVRQETKRENQTGPGGATTIVFEVVDFEIKK